MSTKSFADALDLFHPAVRQWFFESFKVPTASQSLGWPAIARGESTLVLAPTGNGKTLTAFLWCINRLMFDRGNTPRCRVVYISPLKALAFDVERNLRKPLEGVARAAEARGEACHRPRIAVRTGDTPAAERSRFQRDGADILITTPESLYLLLTSNARQALDAVDTVIVDEIHALVGTKRGAHLALSLERLEHLAGHRLQRIGLSATQRPLDEVARFLGGAVAQPDPLLDAGSFRAVTIVDTGERKRLELTIEVPVEDMARLGGHRPGMTAGAPSTSIWSAIHPRLLELVRAHQSTLIFVNNRRASERLAAAINELAEEPLVRSHHGSLAREQRVEVEDLLKSGSLKGLVATSSLELGIDMGAIDLVIQIEAPPSVASGMQRIGRAGHQAGAASRGVMFPKFRGDLLASAAVARAMRDGLVESTRYLRNPLDVLAQQVVAMVSLDAWPVADLFALVRRTAPFHDLGQEMFEDVLEMLAGRYPSDEFAELRPRITWDRVTGIIVAREGARRIAVVNGGTIPDRGLYGVFLANAPNTHARVGELDEEMVFETRVGETFLLGASTWRVEEITHDRVLVSPAPGEPAKTPFWRGDAAGRPVELGRRIGALARELREVPTTAAVDRLVRDHDLNEAAAENLVRYLADQVAAAGAVPDDRTILIERTRDELGAWRVSLLSPLGGKTHAPWAMAAAVNIRHALGIEVETVWTDEGFVVRFPELDRPPDSQLLIPPAGGVERMVMEQLGITALFAARFREAASRALLLPRRRPGARAPLWLQRRRAADLMAVASRYPSFPIVLEAFRECLRDEFDMAALEETLAGIAEGSLRVVTADTETPSPFAASLQFGYVANFIYEGDAPPAERRAHALVVDQAQLKELIGEAELRELLDSDAIDSVEREAQHLDERLQARSADALHDLLLRVGDLSEAELSRRAQMNDFGAAVETLTAAQRVLRVTIATEPRLIAVEHAARYRDALAIRLPAEVPPAFLGPAAEAAQDLVLRYAKTHGPFTMEEFAERYGLAIDAAEDMLRRVVAAGKLLEGAFRPGGTGREWCEPGVLRAIKRRSLARLRRQIEPVEPMVLGRLYTTWQGVARRRSGLEALLDAIESLQGAPIAASILETEVLPARIDEYNPGDLDALVAGGEVLWVGLEPLGERDGRVALYLTDHLPRLWRPAVSDPRVRSVSPASTPSSDRSVHVLEYLAAHGASFFAPLHQAVGGGYPAETVDALWALVWQGLVTNDTLHALRAFVRPPERQRRQPPGERAFRSRRLAPPAAEGRWSLVASRMSGGSSLTQWSAAIAQQLLARYGVVSREVAAAEGIEGGFSAVYDVLTQLEEAGRIRRGYFAAGVGAMQFALPAALDLLRTLRQPPDRPEVVHVAATDPANPYGAIVKWPSLVSAEPSQEIRMSRSVGASVILVNGALAAYLGRRGRQLTVFLPDDEGIAARAIATRLAELAGEASLLIAEINGAPADSHELVPYLLAAGFAASAMGFHVRRQGTSRGA